MPEPALKILRRTMFGNPILRTPSQIVPIDTITSKDIQSLIANMQFTLAKRPYGVGLAAPQVDHGLAISVIGIKPTPSRPDNPLINFVIINPEIVETYGELMPLWEGCISFGSGNDLPYAQAMRFPKVRVRYYDQTAQVHEEVYDGIVAHVLQHEIDHLNGVLFVDRVVDTTTYITMAEYKKRYLQV